MRHKRMWPGLVAVAILLGSSPLASAGNFWSFGLAGCVGGIGGPDPCGSGDSNASTTKDYVDGNTATEALTVSGWSDSTGSITRMEVGDGSTPTGIARYGGGLGVLNTNETSSPQHTVDNGGSRDGVLFDFGTTMRALTSVSLGYVDGDSDISVLYYNGNGAPVIPNVGSWGQLLSNGWSVLDNFANVGTSTVNFNAAGAQVFSSGWLVTAYNTDFGDNWTNDNDRFKISGVTAVRGTGITSSSEPVPEPQTLLLLSLGLLALAVRKPVARSAAPTV